MAFITASFLYDAILLIAGFLVFSYFKFRFYSKHHWKRLNIPYVEPLFLFGNIPKSNIIEPTFERVKKIYLENKEKPLLGIWFYTRPFLLVQDVELIKNMLVKDFQHFHDRGLDVDEKKDPLEGKVEINLFFPK